jgi:hypothetical protein
VARRLLRDGYAFEDIRGALLAEAQVQAEEADVIKQRRWLRRLDTLWYKLWAGRAGRSFFRVAGIGLKTSVRPALAGVEHTELLLGRSALNAYNELPDRARDEVPDVPRVLQQLEAGAEALRARGETGERLTEAVAALEHLRVALIRLQAGQGSVPDLTLALERAREIGAHVDARIEAAREVEQLLK